MTLSEIIKDYWGVILFASGIVFHAIYMYFRVDNHEGRISSLEVEQKDTVSSVDELKNMITGMDSKLDILLEGYKSKKK